MNQEQLTGGTCTWCVQLPDGRYVYDPRDMSRLGYSRDDAHLWLSQESAETWAMRAPWIPIGATAKRARP